MVVVGALIGALHYNFVWGTCSWLVLKLFPGFEGFSTPNPGTRSSWHVSPGHRLQFPGTLKMSTTSSGSEVI